MAEEWVKVELLGANRDGEPRAFNCASGTAIAKGTVLTLTDERIAIADAGASQALIAGIAAADKSATDFSTSISCWTQGIFIATASGATVGIGDVVGIWGNKIITAVGVGAYVAGYALSEINGASTGQVRLNL